MQDFRKLKVWNNSIEYSYEIYKLSKGFPREEMFGITSQLRRASLSISLNIAEGCGRGSSKDFAKFLRISLGSTNECLSLIILINKLGIVDHQVYEYFEIQTVEIKKMLINLIKSLSK